MLVTLRDNAVVRVLSSYSYGSRSAIVVEGADSSSRVQRPLDHRDRRALRRSPTSAL